MKFQDISAEFWQENITYFDTCILPFSGLEGDENPLQIKEKLQNLQTYLQQLEQRFQGRIVIQPAFHYMSSNMEAYIDQIAKKLPYRFFGVVDPEKRLNAEAFSHVHFVLQNADISVVQKTWENHQEKSRT